MSRLYTVSSSVADIAAQFDAQPPADLIVPSETIEGLPGLVVYEKHGRRLLRRMDWGFPLITPEIREKDERPDRLGLVANLNNPFWSRLVVTPRYRCLIPLSAFANPAGIEGEKTRSWFSVKGHPLIAWAGFCRNIPDYGPVYAGMTMAANDAVMPYNDRMPAILMPAHYDRWLHGPIEDVLGFQFRAPMPADYITVEHSEDLWKSGKLPPSLQKQMALF